MKSMYERSYRKQLRFDLRNYVRDETVLQRLAGRAGETPSNPEDLRQEVQWFLLAADQCRTAAQNCGDPDESEEFTGREEQFRDEAARLSCILDNLLGA